MLSKDEGDYWLQWGHGDEAVENRRRRLSGCTSKGLQWGHGEEAVENPGCSPRTRGTTGFNGATAMRPWKTGGGGYPAALPRGFNGATAKRPWKTPDALQGRGGLLASMGPRR